MNRKKRIIRNRIPDRLRELNRSRGEDVELSQGWLSRESGISRQHLNKIVNCKYNPQLLTAKKIARALRCTIDDLWFI